MVGKTHEEGGFTALIIALLIIFFTFPFTGHVLMETYLAIAFDFLLLSKVCTYASTMKDSDQNERAMPSKDVLSYVLHCVTKKLDKNHRSIVTHNVFVDLVAYLVPIIFIVKNNYVATSNWVLDLFLYSALLGMLLGNIAHLALDKFTVEGFYHSYALYFLIKYKILKKDINDIRVRLRTKLKVKNKQVLLTLRYPFFSIHEPKDYGRTGGQYEAIFASNLRNLNYYFIYVIVFLFMRPDFSRILDFVTKTYDKLK